MQKKRLDLFLIFALLLVTASHADSYDVIIKGQRAGRADLAIHHQAEYYQIDLALYPVALAKLFGIDDMFETVTGEIRAGHFYPQNYRRVNDTGHTLLNVSFVNEIAQVTEKNKRKQLKISALGQDPLSQIAQIQQDLQQNRLQPTYDLISKNKQHRYQAKLRGKQVILTEQPSGRYQIHLWFDETFALTKLEKHKGSNLQFSVHKIQQ